MTNPSVPTKRKPQSQTAGAEQAGFVARLKLVVAQWPSADRLARATGVSPSAFRKWLKGEAEPSRDRLVALAGTAGVSVAWLAQGEGPEPDLVSLDARARSPDMIGPDRTPFHLLPKVPEGVAAGSGRPVPSPATEFIGFRHDWLRSTFSREPETIILETAIGDSMEPHIGNGDLLLVDTTDQSFRNFGVYVIEMRAERLVKRVQRKFDGSLILISDNSRYQAETISADLAREVRVVGRVIWRGGSL
ncbi:MAG: helix-turn-helix transcriptional regulator [Proteobacteria bacterium]|nr:helix-turn-helix transcriptional regulator [Pseudomonadota bacterium]